MSKVYDCHAIEWLNESTLLYHYENYYGAWDHKLTFTIIDDQEYGGKTIEARTKGDCFDVVLLQGFHSRKLGYLKASDGCFIASDSLDGESPLEDELIMSGRMTVVRLIQDDHFSYAEVRPDPEWLASLPVKVVNPTLRQNELHFDIEEKVAKTLHGDFEWVIEESDPRYGCRYSIEVTNTKNHHMGFAMGGDSLMDAWLKAMQYEKAVVELFNEGERIAAKVGVEFFDMFENIAGHNWYLEG